MTARICSVLTLIGIVALAACSAPDDGGREVLVPVPDDPTVTFKIWFQVGSKEDPAGKEGLAYLTGQMIAEGATTNRSYREILEAQFPIATAYSVRVDKDMTVLTGRTHLDNVDRFLELFEDAFARPAFLESDFERHRKDAINALETNLRYAGDEELGKAALHGTVFAGTPYEHLPIGTVSGLKEITLDDVRAFWERWYTRARAVPALGGGYDDALLARLRASLEALPEGDPAAVPVEVPVPTVADGRRVVLVDKPGADASISFGFPIDVRRGEDDFYALWLATSWLGEHRNSASHLYQVIRETRGMNYGDYAYIEWYPEGGYRQMPPTGVGRSRQIFEVWIRTLPNEQAHFALRAAMREVEDLVENGMSEEEFELTRSFLEKYILHYATTTSERLGYAVDDAYYGIADPGHLARFRQEMAAMSRERVNDALRRHFRPESATIAIVTGDAAGLAGKLASDAPSPMTYNSPKPPEVLAEDAIIQEYPLGIGADDVRIVPVDSMFE
jgi:zinc protease